MHGRTQANIDEAQYFHLVGDAFFDFALRQPVALQRFLPARVAGGAGNLLANFLDAAAQLVVTERLQLEASALKQNPMLIQKIIAERLSDKLQIMMVPSDGKFFFANDVFRSAFAGAAVTEPEEKDPQPDPAVFRRPVPGTFAGGANNGTRRPPR